MPQQLFSIAKIGLFLDGFRPGTEKRRGEETKIITCNFRVQAFDVKHTIAIDDGLGGDTNVRASLFNLSTDDPKPHVERVNLSLGCPRQTLIVFPAPDAPTGRIALAQVKIGGTYARTQKDVAGYAFCFTASFGPVGKDELEFLNAWFLSQQFVIFEEAEPGLFDEDDDQDDLIDAGPVVDGRAPLWDDGDEATPVAQSLDDEHTREVAAKPVKPRGTKKKTGRHNPDVERADQVKAAKSKPNGAAHA